MSLSVKIIPARQKHTGTVIWLHGLGQMNDLWVGCAQSIALSLPHVRWVFPQCPDRASPFNGGLERPSWFDIHHLPPTEDEFNPESPELQQSISNIKELVLSETSTGLEMKRIVLVGFSQGAATSLITGLSSFDDLAGLVSLSGWIPSRIREQILKRSSSFPILWCHGLDDTEIPDSMGRDAVLYLRSLGHKVDLKLYNGLDHSVNEDELADVKDWLKLILPEK